MKGNVAFHSHRGEERGVGKDIGPPHQYLAARPTVGSGSYLARHNLQAAELKELKEFTSKLKTLPQIQRHIELLTSIQASSSKPGFKEKISLEQELLDDNILDPACQYLEVDPFFTSTEATNWDISIMLSFSGVDFIIGSYKAGEKVDTFPIGALISIAWTSNTLRSVCNFFWFKLTCWQTP